MTTRQLVRTALFAALTAVGAFLKIPLLVPPHHPAILLHRHGGLSAGQRLRGSTTPVSWASPDAPAGRSTCLPCSALRCWSPFWCEYGLPLSIQTTLLFAGIGTLLFHVCTKFKVPAFLGSSFAFLGGFQAVASLDLGKFAAMTGEEKLAYALGGVVVAGLLYLVLALLFKLVGAKKVMRFFPPIVTGPIIILIGLNLSGTAVTNASTCWWLALVAIAIIIVANIWGKGMIKIIPILLGVVGSYIVALIAGKVDFTEVAGADIVGLQKFVIAKFDVTSILVMAPIAIAAMMEHIGDVSAISSTTGKNFISDPGLHRTLLYAIILSFSPEV